MTVSRVVLAASDVSQIPAGAEVLGSQCRRCLESTGREDHAASGTNGAVSAVLDDLDTHDVASQLIRDDANGWAVIVDLHTMGMSDLSVPLEQLFALAWGRISEWL